MSSSGSTSNNMNNTIDENKMERMMDYLAFTVNENGREMIETLGKIKADMKNVTKKILKEKISIKRKARSGNREDYTNLTSLENEYNTLLREYGKCVREVQEQRQSLIEGGMEVIKKTEESSPKKKRKRRRKRRKKKVANEKVANEKVANEKVANQKKSL